MTDLSESVRIFGPDESDHLDLVRDGEQVSFVHYKLLPVETVGQQSTWADVAMVSMDWARLLEAIDELKGGDDDRRTQIQTKLF